MKSFSESSSCIIWSFPSDLKKPQNVIDSLISITEHVIVDSLEYFLLFLQNMFPYLEKYLMTDYLPKLVDRIKYTMNQIELAGDSCKINDTVIYVSKHSHSNVCDRALLVDYRAELLVMKNTLRCIYYMFLRMLSHQIALSL